jgi:hypothetical protein
MMKSDEQYNDKVKSRSDGFNNLLMEWRFYTTTSQFDSLNQKLFSQRG